MNYKLIYNSLIARAQQRLVITGYTEKHHIIPRCMGGDNTKNNLVTLTAREHFIAHLLLIKIYPENRKLVHAAYMMTVSSKNQVRSNRLYEWVRMKHSSAAKQRTGDKNGSFGKRWYHNPITLENGKFAVKPNGWQLGRKPSYNTLCEICKTDTGSKQRRFCDLHRPRPLSPTEKGFVRTAQMNEHMSSLYKGRPKEKHHQYGKKWINNGKIQLMVPIDEVSKFLDQDWTVGKLKRTLS